MQPFNAISLAPTAREWLATSRHPRILYLFDQVCNLINEQGEVLSIVTPGIGNGPFNLVVEDEICFSEHLGIESPISISPTQLYIGDLIIETAEAKLWNPRPDWEKLHARRDDILDQLLSLSLPDHQLSVPDTLASNLSSPLASKDMSTAKTIATQLAGLGIGLTPTGDDFIMGATYAVWIIHPPKNARLLAQEIIKTAVPLTTSLSAAWLRSAGRGEVGILWHQFFDALVTGEEVEFHIAKILAVGETSGADAFSGFLRVCSAFKDV